MSLGRWGRAECRGQWGHQDRRVRQGRWASVVSEEQQVRRDLEEVLETLDRRVRKVRPDSQVRQEQREKMGGRGLLVRLDQKGAQAPRVQWGRMGE